MSLARWSVAVFCAKAILLVLTVGALHPRCAAQRPPDISGTWDVSGGYHFLAKTHLWITVQMAGAPKAVLYAAYDNPQPALVTSALLQGSGKPDAQVAAQIHGTRLTERLSTTRLTRLEANIPRP